MWNIGEILKPTLKQIAEMAGVSIGTVHRAIHKNGPVSKENLERIELIIKKLDYKPNIIARTLVKGQSMRIGVIMPMPEQDGHYWNLPEMGIKEAVRDLQHFHVQARFYFFDKCSESSFVKAGEQALNDDINGLLIAPVQQKAIHKVLDMIPGNLPYVFFDSNIPGAACLSTIHQNSLNAGYVAAKLMRLYHQKSATISIFRFLPDTFHINQRMRGFQDYLSNQEEIKLIVTDIPAKYSTNERDRIIENLLKTEKNLKGIFVADAHTYEVAAYFASVEKTQKISIIGFDLIEANVQFLKKGYIDVLISQHPDLQGYMGIQTLYRYLMLDEKINVETLMPIEIITQENIDFSRSYNFQTNANLNHLSITYELDH